MRLFLNSLILKGAQGQPSPDMVRVGRANFSISPSCPPKMIFLDLPLLPPKNNLKENQKTVDHSSMHRVRDILLDIRNGNDFILC